MLNPTISFYIINLFGARGLDVLRHAQDGSMWLHHGDFVSLCPRHVLNQRANRATSVVSSPPANGFAKKFGRGSGGGPRTGRLRSRAVAATR